MIYVTRINNKEFAINPDLIETLEATPDTVIALTTNNKYVVKESIDEIIARIVEFRRSCYLNARGEKDGDEN